MGIVGQQEKLDSCLMAAKSGRVRAVVMASVEANSSILNILRGMEIGTLFCSVKDRGAMGIEATVLESLNHRSML